MSMKFVLCACRFNSRRICAQFITCIGSMPIYSILGGYVHNFYIQICLTNFWMKDPLGMLEDSLWSITLLRILVMILTYHEVLIMYGPLRRGVACWGFFNSVSFTRELPSTREMIIFLFLINHWGLMLSPPSKLFYQTLLGIFFSNSQGATSLLWTHGGVHLWY